MESQEMNFKLLDMTGSENIFDYNSARNVLVYSVGCMIVYWEISTDKKLFIKYHEGIVGCLKFTKSGNYLISIDKLFSPKIVVWEVPSLEVYFQSNLPLNCSYINDDLKYLRERSPEAKMSSIENICLEFLTKNSFIIIVNIESKQLLFNFEFSKQINLKFDTTLEMESYCLGLKAFPNTNTFITLEEKIVKLWKIDDNMKVKLSTKIHLKQKLLQDSIQICEYLKIFLFLNENGSCLILDDAGNFLISIGGNSFSEKFCSAFVLNECVFLGNERGSVNAYTLNGFKPIGIYNYDLSNKNKFLLNKPDLSQSLKNLSDKHLTSSSNQAYGSKIPITGPNVSKIISNEENNILIIKYIDNSSLVTNLSTSFPNYPFSSSQLSSILKYKYQSFNYTHFNKVTDILWLNDDPKTFFTCSEDQSIMKWTYRGDKWVNHYFDILKLFDSHLNNYTINGDGKGNDFKSLNTGVNINSISSSSRSLNAFNPLNKYFIQVLTLHPRYQNNIVGGDNKGSIYIFDNEYLSNQNVKKIVVGNFPISSLTFSNNGNYLAVGFETGLVVLTDFYNDCKFCIKLEDHFLDTSEVYQRKQDTYSILSFVYIMKIKAGNKKETQQKLSTPNVNSDINTGVGLGSSLSESKTSRNNFNNYHNNYYFSLNSDETSFRVLSLKDSNTFRIQNITIQKNNFLKSTFKELSFPENIKNALVHPSEDYLIVLMKSGIISINKIETNQVCGEIMAKMNIYDFRIDPSGLYLAILGDYTGLHDSDNNNESILNNDIHLQSNSNSNHGRTNFLNKDMIKDKSEKGDNMMNSNTVGRFNNFSNNNSYYNYNTASNLGMQRNHADKNNLKDNIDFKSVKVNIAFYEIGTGKFASSLNDNFKVENFRFSNDGRFMNIISEQGCVSVWMLPKEMKENILSILEEMRKNANFWDSFLINYKNNDRNTNVTYNDIITKSLDKTMNSFRGYNRSNSFHNTKEEISKIKQRSKEAQTANMEINLNQANVYDVDDKSAKSLYIDLSVKDKKTDSVKHSVIESATQAHANHHNSSNYLLQKSKSIQTSMVNNDILVETKKKKSDEWAEKKKYERLGLSDENMRVINKDPSIYPINQPSVIQKAKNSFSNTNINIPLPDLNKVKVEEVSKMRNDEIRNRNIEKAIRDLENSDSNYSKEKHKIKEREAEANLNTNIHYTANNEDDSHYYNHNYFINNTRDKKNHQILPDPSDIDDIYEDNASHSAQYSNTVTRNYMKYHDNLSNYSNLYNKTKDSLADDIEFAYDNIQNFEKMHNFN